MKHRLLAFLNDVQWILDVYQITLPAGECYSTLTYGEVGPEGYVDAVRGDVQTMRGMVHAAQETTTALEAECIRLQGMLATVRQECQYMINWAAQCGVDEKAQPLSPQGRGYQAGRRQAAVDILDALHAIVPAAPAPLPPDYDTPANCGHC